MKNYIFSFLLSSLFFLTNCSVNNYYLCTISEPLEVYSAPESNSKVAIIQSNKQVVVEGKPNKKYRKVRFGVYSGFITSQSFSSVKRVSKYQLPSLVTLTDTTSRISTARSYTPSSGTVYVKGYYRKDGTYVKPHTRSAPKRH